MGYERSQQGNKQPKDTLDLISSLVGNGTTELASEAQRTGIYYLKSREEKALENIKNQGKYLGISTGYPTIDKRLGSFLPGELMTIGGDTGHGKSLFAQNIAQNVYRKYLQSVLVVNLELTEDQSIERFYFLSGDDHDYAGILSQESPEVSYKDIDILMEKAKEEDVCLVVIDHLHFFNSSFGDNQANELSRIMKHFKGCAVKFNLPIILLSHVTPTTIVDKEGNVQKTIKPGLHSFKGSRSIEQISDMVGFVFRDNENKKNVEFYLRKNRSRELVEESVYLNQIGWRLEEEWAPRVVHLKG